MSGYLAGKVWLSDLAPTLKPLAAALADCANDDGTDIFPGVEYTSWKLGDSERTVQRGIKALVAMNILELVANGSGGRGRRAEYRMIKEQLPQRPKWSETKGDKMSPLKSEKGDKRRTQRVTNATSSLLLDPSVDPSKRSGRSDQKQVQARKAPKRSRHDDHFFCGECICVTPDKHAAFSRRIVIAGCEIEDLDLMAFYKTKDDELFHGTVTTTDHPNFWLEQEFTEALKLAVQEQ